MCKTLENWRTAEDLSVEKQFIHVIFIMTVNDPTAPVDFLTPTATPPSGNVAENTPVSARQYKLVRYNEY